MFNLASSSSGSIVDLRLSLELSLDLTLIDWTGAVDPLMLCVSRLVAIAMNSSLKSRVLTFIEFTSSEIAWPALK